MLGQVFPDNWTQQKIPKAIFGAYFLLQCPLGRDWPPETAAKNVWITTYLRKNLQDIHNILSENLFAYTKVQKNTDSHILSQ